MFTGVSFLILSSLCGGESRESKDLRPLLEVLHDADIETRAYIGSAIATLGAQAVFPLQMMLYDKDDNARAGAAYALSQLGLAAAPAKTDLLVALSDPDRAVRRQAAYALSKLYQAQRDAALPTTAPPPGEFPAEFKTP